MNDHISSPIEEVEDHQHCTTCIKTYKCKHKRPSENKCPIVDCSQGCGFEFHRCKQTDHSLLCRNERVSSLLLLTYSNVNPRINLPLLFVDQINCDQEINLFRFFSLSRYNVLIIILDAQFISQDTS